MTQLNIEKIETQKTKNNEEIQSLEINNKRIDSDINVIVLKIPSLEEEKQKYVISKNFKEAGKISGELKAQKEEKDKLSSKIQENKSKISLLKDVNDRLDRELALSIEEKQKVVKELNILKYQYLLSYKHQIEEQLERVRIKGNEETKLFEEELKMVNKDILLLYENDYIRAKFLDESKQEKMRQNSNDNNYEIKIKEAMIHEEHKEIEVNQD